MSGKKSSLFDLMTKYKTEFEEDAVINEFNLKDKQLMLPGIKHKYVAYLIQHKVRKHELENIKKEAIEELFKKENLDIGLSKQAMEKKYENSAPIQKINSLIKEQDIIIDYLEKIEIISKSMTYDISNIIKIMELETT
jgi:hypothetical protein